MKERRRRATWSGVVATLLCTGAGFGQLQTANPTGPVADTSNVILHNLFITVQNEKGHTVTDATVVVYEPAELSLTAATPRTFGPAGEMTKAIRAAAVPVYFAQCPGARVGFQVIHEGETRSAQMTLGAVSYVEVLLELLPGGMAATADAQAAVGVCGGGNGDCCAANGSPGCDDPDCCNSVCAADPFCCDTSWDGICADAAANDPNCNCNGGPTCPVPVDCPPGSEDEGEGCGNATNEGCNTIGGPPVYQDATCGSTWCGTLYADGGTRDTDWYLISHAGGPIIATVVSEMPTVCFIVDGIGACAPVVVGSGCSAAGVPIGDAAADLPAGQYVIFVAAGECGGAGIFEGFPCSDACQDYYVTITCNPDTVCPGEGDCCVVNGTPGCDDAGCCNAVCGIDPFCCDNTWDGICAVAAATHCPDLCLVPPLTNDDCGNSIEIFEGTTPFENIAATNDGPSNCGLMGSDVWYHFNATCTGTLTVDTCGSGYDTVLNAYDGCTCPVGASLACNDDFCGLQSTIVFNVVAGNCYMIQVGGFNGGQGSGVINIAIECTTGACCVESECEQLTEDDCASASGEYQGDGTSCDGGFLGYDVILGPDLGFQFEDISATGTEAPTASTSDDGGDVIDLPFEFCFFDNFYNSVGIASNGYLTFGGNLGDFTNDPIPNATDPNDLIAPYWDDWSPNQGGTVQYEARTSPDRFIVQWTDVPHFNSVGQSTFQAILFADGAIEFHYDGVIIDSPTVGIENADGTDGIDVTGQAPPSVRFEKLTGEAAICEVPGACCWDEGCLIVLENECLALPGGNFLGEGTDCTPDWIGDPGLYLLHNDPDNSQAPPPYGLRTDELIDVSLGHDIFTFNFDPTLECVAMYLCYDGSTIRIFGTAFGGRDQGLSYDPYWSGPVFIDFLYDTGVAVEAIGDTALIVEAAAAGQNSGEICFLPTDCCSPHGGTGCETLGCEIVVCQIDPSCCDVIWDQDCADQAADVCLVCSGDTFPIYDYAGNNPVTFRFGENGLAFGGGAPLTGEGWLVGPNPDSAYILANDWAFVGVPFDVNGTLPEESEAVPTPARATPAAAGPRGASTGVR